MRQRERERARERESERARERESKRARERENERTRERESESTRARERESERARESIFFVYRTLLGDILSCLRAGSSKSRCGTKWQLAGSPKEKKGTTTR